MIISKETCPYFSKEKRAQWFEEKGLRNMEAAPTSEEFKPPKAKPVETVELTKEQRYRAANRAKLAEKARARRAQGK